MIIETRDAVDDDLYVLLSIQKEAFARYTDHLRAEQIPPLNETIEDMKKDLKYKSVVTASVDGRTAGSIRYYIKGGVCIIERLSVRPDMQGRGIGCGLIAEVEKRAAGLAHKLYLETGLLASNLIMFIRRSVFRRKPSCANIMAGSTG